jgi:hypothetical protein
MKNIQVSFTFLVFHGNLFSQAYSQNAKLFFNKIKTYSAATNFGRENLPSLDQCNYVFMGNAAYFTYFFPMQ